MAASGLGIRIPTDIPIETYIEIAKDYQPRISSTIRSISATQNDKSSLIDLSKNISSINREIDRVKGLRRFAVLEACAGFYRKNTLLIGGALLAAAMGFTTGLLGCAATGAVAAGRQLAKNKKWLPDNSSIQRLGRIVARDVQPYTDVLLKGYLGSTSPAIGVLSLQKRIEAASQKNKK